MQVPPLDPRDKLFEFIRRLIRENGGNGGRVDRFYLRHGARHAAVVDPQKAAATAGIHGNAPVAP